VSVYHRNRKGPFRDDLLVLSVAVLMVFVLYIVVDYPSTMAKAPGNAGNPGGPGPNPGPQTLTLVNEDLLDESGRTNEGQSTEVPFEVPWSAVTWINLTLTWTDDIGNNDQFELKVLADGQEVGSADGTTGNVPLSIKAPPTGNYTAVVSCINAPGFVGPSPIDRDSGNDWALKAVAEREVLQ
jgi:hypothetical protein